ncbi:hypothetical protein WG219_11825 [Ectopseudomonas mendocina]|uniref:Uncharacterized protein n=1 Tax=Ectopseudomonas mendocina TaxID=300 RepID=A0ABZ2RDM3_ECTME
MINFSFIASLATASSYSHHHHDSANEQQKAAQSAQQFLNIHNVPVKNPQPSDK